MEDYLKNIIENSATRLSEFIFKKRYLPLLFDKDPGLFNLTWLNEVARNPHARVFIISDTDEIIFSVPPLRVSPLKHSSNNINGILNEIQATMNMHGILGINLLDKSLPEMIQFSDGSNKTYIDEWKAILDRYDLTSKYTGNVVENKENSLEYLEDSDEGWC